MKAKQLLVLVMRENALNNQDTQISTESRDSTPEKDLKGDLYKLRIKVKYLIAPLWKDPVLHMPMSRNE